MKDLNTRLNDIRREQVFQRVSSSFVPIPLHHDLNMDEPNRNGKLNSVTNLRARMGAWCGGF